MGLFDKKFCDVCGEKIGLLGNRKLSDGNLCKNCASKLSPWFSERRQSSIEDIKQQLAYREDNRAAVAEFNITRTFGSSTKLHLDEDKHKFMVTSARDLAEANPDVLDYSQITGCWTDIKESRNELKTKGPDGKMVSYNPPRYEYIYNFYMVVNVNHPYFDEIRFPLHSTGIRITPNVGPLGRPGMPAPGVNKPGMRPGMMRGAFANAGVDPTMNSEYRRCQTMADDIIAALTCVREESREEAAAAAIPPKPVTCQCCGATGLPDAKGCCEYCGSVLNA